MTGGAGSEELRRILLESRDLGFLGPGPVDAHIEHARGFAAVAESTLGHPPSTFVDLGTGGGVPGLVLAQAWPAARGVFVESVTRRSALLREWVERLGLSGRIDVRAQRAEVVARDPDWRERAELVTARSFAAPAVTAEIAAGLVAVEGAVVVSEPPERDPARWPSEGLAGLGFGPARTAEGGGRHFVAFRKQCPAPANAPRGVGRPAKRPLW